MKHTPAIPPGPIAAIECDNGTVIQPFLNNGGGITWKYPLVSGHYELLAAYETECTTGTGAPRYIITYRTRVSIEGRLDTGLRIDARGDGPTIEGAWLNILDHVKQLLDKASLAVGDHFMLVPPTVPVEPPPTPEPSPKPFVFPETATLWVAYDDEPAGKKVGSCVQIPGPRPDGIAVYSVEPEQGLIRLLVGGGRVYITNAYLNRLEYVELIAVEPTAWSGPNPTYRVTVKRKAKEVT